MLFNELDTPLFVGSGNIVRMGMAPVRIEGFNEVDGGGFKDLFFLCSVVEMDRVK